MLQQKAIQFFSIIKNIEKWVKDLPFGGHLLVSDYWCWTVVRAKNKLIWIVCYKNWPP